MFLEFVTGTTVISDTLNQQIIIELIELNENEHKMLPSSSTCNRSLILQYHCTKHLEMEESFKQFENMMNISLSQGLHFGNK